jgi:hypothetical protein
VYQPQFPLLQFQFNNKCNSSKSSSSLPCLLNNSNNNLLDFSRDYSEAAAEEIPEVIRPPT